MYSAGTAYLSVVPSFRGIERALQRQAEQIGRQVDQSIAKAVPQGVREGMERSDREVQRAGERAGAKYAGAFASGLARNLDKAATSIRISGDTSDLDRDLADVRKDLLELRDAVINVDVDGDFAMLELRRIEAKLRELRERDGTVEYHVDVASALNSIEEIGQAQRRAVREHARMLDEAYAENERLDRERGLMLDRAYAEDERRDRDRQKMLREAYAENEQRDRDRAAAALRLQGGAFGEQQRRRIGAAADALPQVHPLERTSPAQDDFARLRPRLAAVQNVTVGVDIDTSRFTAEIGDIVATLERIERDEVDISIKSNARAALAELRALTGLAGEEGNKAGEEYGGSLLRSIREKVRTAGATITDIQIGVDTTEAQFDLQELKARLQALGDVRVGVDMPMADFIREVTLIENRLADLEMDDVEIQVRLEAAAARAGLTALHQQINAVDRDDIEIDVDANTAGATMALLAMQAGVTMTRFGALVAVGAAIGTAIVPAAAAATAAVGALAMAAGAAIAGLGVTIVGLVGPIKAVAALNKYQQEADKSARNLSQTHARVASAMDQVDNAASNLVTSQRNLTRAEKDAAETTKDLTKARESAQRQLEDMALAVRDGALAQRQARLDEAEAKKNLDKLLANPRATQDEREQAKITHEQRMLQIEQLSLRQDRLVKDEEVARLKGVEGSDQVVAAQQRIADAMDRVLAAQESVVDSQRAVEAANRAVQQAYEQTGVAGGEALRNLRQEMDALSPAGQRFALFLFGLKDEIKGLQATAEAGLLPGVQRGLENLMPYLKPLDSFVSKVSTAMGDGFAYATERLKDPIWQDFFGYMDKVAGPAISGMFEFFMNMSEGVAGVLLGLSGFNGPAGEGILNWSRDFAKWGTTLDKNEGWQKFIGFIKESWPEVRDFFKGLWDFTKKFVAAAAPIGEWVAGAFAKLFEWLDKLDTGDLKAFAAAIAGVSAALLVIGGITALLTAGLVTLIVVGVAALVVALIWLYRHVTPVRVVFDALWAAIKIGWNFVWNSVLKPGFALLMAGLSWLGGVFKALWTGALQPLFGVFQSFFGVVIGGWQRAWVIVGPILSMLGDGFKTIGGLLLWLWNSVVSPVLGFILVGLKILWAAFQVALGLIQIGLKLLGAALFYLWDHSIKIIWDKIKPFFQWLGGIVQEYVEPKLKEGLKALGKAWDWFVDLLKVPVRFVVETVLNDGLLAGYNKIAKMFKVKPDDVHIDLPKGFAHGGAVRGPGTRTSDSINARLSDGEHVWTADEVDAIGGHKVMYALRRMALDGILPTFARGGAVGSGGRGDGWGVWNEFKRKAGDAYNGIKDFASDPAGAIRRLYDKFIDLIPGKDIDMVRAAIGMPGRVVQVLIDKVKDLFGGEDGAAAPGHSGGTLGGSSGMMQILNAIFRDLPILSGYRPGSTTLSGSRSYHADDRAVDVPPREDVARWIYANFGAGTKELITPWQQYNLLNGKRHTYTGAVWNQHNFAGGNAHVHWAYDQGGYLPQGFAQVYNGTGGPEPVLTTRQWADIHQLATANAGGPRVLNRFEFRDTTLDPSRLRAVNEREAAINRDGRAR